MGTLYLSTKFELDWFTNNEDLSLDRNHWKRTQTRTETESGSIKKSTSFRVETYNIIKNQIQSLSCQLAQSVEHETLNLRVGGSHRTLSLFLIKHTLVIF